MHAVDVPRETSTGLPPRSHPTRAALLVVVLGILPFVLDAPVVWRVLGPLVAAAILFRSLQLVWREVFSTDPRHLGRT